MNGYIAFYNSSKKEIYANSAYEAQEKAIVLFMPPKSKRHMVSVHLAELDGKQVVHSTGDV